MIPASTFLQAHSFLLQEFCASKASAASHVGASDDAETWTFMGVLFEDDARRQ
jgi:hypothetical protein